MNKKGISPLISVVLLVALVIATAGIVSQFYLRFSRERTKEVADRGSQTITCSYAGLYINNAEYNATSNLFLLDVTNTGQIDLTDFKIQIQFGNRSTAEYIPTRFNETMSPGDNWFFKNSSIGTCSIDKVIFLSERCPVDSSDQLSGSSISFYNC
ncbi:MAG: archaellin/type IV pilin N-terminal domain-containing protein [Candidatus Aenigmatarchaeota archaeon]